MGLSRPKQHARLELADDNHEVPEAVDKGIVLHPQQGDVQFTALGKSH